MELFGEKENESSGYQYMEQGFYRPRKLEIPPAIVRNYSRVSGIFVSLSQRLIEDDGTKCGF